MTKIKHKLRVHLLKWYGKYYAKKKKLFKEMENT